MISLCMIARDEEAMIGRALASVRGLVDELIVVDTGSVDHTIEIAIAYGAKVVHSPWRKDFAYHRNEAIAHATGEWILCLDCDEVLQPVDWEMVKCLLVGGGSGKKGYNISITNVIDGTPRATFEALRFFKNREGFQYEGAIHEQILGSICEKYGEEAIGALPLEVYHYGYEREVLMHKNKSQRNLEILHGLTQKDGYYYAMLGDEYLRLGKLEQAATYYQQSLEQTGAVLSGYGISLVLNYGSTLINLGRYESARRIIDDVAKQDVVFKDLYFLEYWIADRMGKYEEALEALDKYREWTYKPQARCMSFKRFEQVYNLEMLRVEVIRKVKIKQMS